MTKEKEPAGESEVMTWGEWWFFHGGQIHQAWKYRQWTLLRDIATTTPKEAWDHQQVIIDQLRKERDELKNSNDTLRQIFKEWEELLGDMPGVKIRELIRERDELRAKLSAFKFWGTNDCEVCDDGRIILFCHANRCIKCAPEDYRSAKE